LQNSSDGAEKEPEADFKRRYQSMLILENEAAEGIASNANVTSEIASLSQPNSSSNAVDAITDLATTLKRPLMRKLPHFSGCPKEWPAFITLYEATTQEGNFSEADNVAQLREALKGDALSHVLSILSFSTKASETIDALRKIYGRPDVLVLRLTQELIGTTDMKSETDSKLKDFSLAVSSYVQSMKALSVLLS
jgi:Protein of unknown function (DUF1759)